MVLASKGPYSQTMPKNTDEKRKKSDTQSADNASAVRAQGKPRPRADANTGIRIAGDLSTGKGGSGLDVIDDLFAAKKIAKKEAKTKEAKEEDERRRRRRKRREEESAAQGGTAGSSAAAAAPSHLRSKAKKLASMTHSRDDAAGLKSGEWASDGRGGIFDGEGYTGRKVDGGMKIFKAHLFNKEGFGTTTDCPFDCNCCFI